MSFGTGSSNLLHKGDRRGEVSDRSSLDVNIADSRGNDL